jgi:hypothetical protein
MSRQKRRCQEVGEREGRPGPWNRASKGHGAVQPSQGGHPSLQVEKLRLRDVSQLARGCDIT